MVLAVLDHLPPQYRHANKPYQEPTKGLLDQTFVILAEAVEEMTLAVGPELPDVYTRKLLSPLEGCLAAFETLRDGMSKWRGASRHEDASACWTALI